MKSEQTDAELLALLNQSNREAFDSIYTKYWERLFLYVVKIIKDSDDAQDLIQEIFVSIWLRREKLKDVGSLSAYLFTAARYKSITYIKANLHKNNNLESLINSMPVLDNSLSESHSFNELETDINREIDFLPLKMRVIFLLSRVDGLPYKQISEKLGISDKTVKKQISNALKHLRIKLSGRYLPGLILVLISDWYS